MNEFVYSVLNQNEISIRIVSAEMPWQLMVAVNFSDVRELITSNCTFAPLCRKEGDTVVVLGAVRVYERDGMRANIIETLILKQS